MPKVYRDGNKVEFLVERLDGGRNTKDSPSLISPYESPDELNVTYDDAGSVGTRGAIKYFNTQAIGSHTIQGGISYNGSMIVAAGGSLYRASNTTFVTIASAQSVFNTTAKLSFVKYQGLLFMSDGTSSYKYADDTRFHKMGIDVPSAATGSGTSAGIVAAGTYYYKVAFVNTQAVAGQVGSASAGVTIAASQVIGVTDIPVGVTSAGVNARWVYRASTTTSTFKRVGVISDNTTTTFADNTALGSEGVVAVTDGGAPGPWTTAALHKDVIFYDDSTDRSLLAYTNYTNPFISEAENFLRCNTQSGKEITAVDVQDDLITAFMDNDETWLTDIVDPSDDTTWVGPYLSPSNFGITGPMAKQRIINGLMFAGKQNGRFTGFHLLTGLILQQTSDGKLRTESISERIEPDLLGTPSARWEDIAMYLFDNRVYISIATEDDTNGYNAHILWFDTTRLGGEGQPGSWGLWSGVPIACFWEHNGVLYGGASTGVGFVYKLNQTGFTDLTSQAINSYWWWGLNGLGESVENFHKDFRFANIFFERFGNYNMRFKRRVDGDTGSGDVVNISLNPGGSLWGTMIWGVDPWGGGDSDGERRVPIGPTRGKRIQVGFDNNNTAGQGFKVHRFSLEATVRSRRTTT